MTPIHYARHVVPQLPDGWAHFQFTPNAVWFRREAPAGQAWRTFTPTHR